MLSDANNITCLFCRLSHLAFLFSALLRGRAFPFWFKWRGVKRLSLQKTAKRFYQTDPSLLSQWRSNAGAACPPRELTARAGPDHPGNLRAQRLASEPGAGYGAPACASRAQPSPRGRVVHIQQRLVEVGQVKVVLGFVIFRKSFILGGRKFTQRGEVSVHISNIKPVRLIKISIPKKKNF